MQNKFIKKNAKYPLVSVIMNCFNGEKFLSEAIDSVYAQTFQDWEIIFWDNASSDRTAKIAKSYDKKLKYFRASKTTALGEARVAATKMAKGKYLAFLDCDDIWLKDKLRDQVEIFKNYKDEVGIVYGRSEVIFESNTQKNFVFKEDKKLPEGDVLSELAKENFIIFSSAMVNKKKFFECGGFPVHLYNSTDYWIFLHMAKKYSCGVFQEVCCKNRIHDGSLSVRQKVIGAEESIAALRDLLPDDRVEKGLQNQYVNLIIMQLKERKFLTAINILKRHGGLIKVLNRIFIRIKSYIW
ncbi:MAG: hypothetical protein CBC25_04320 [Pelagibacteraceae bacterium TMED65]|nr:MAG: hypothetical protein CBC25_04320 [Pelagibacteraceae bacterium TMED65]|tara:strand:- start:1938 stop:2828 length:891 start_codon:yes stop_codon:yes gene_type:complete